jgi:hypothetical protein
MRSKIFIALVATAIGMSSCDRFKNASSTSKSYNLQGKWIVDSIADPGSGDTTGWLALASVNQISVKDSVPFMYNSSTSEVIFSVYGTPSDTATYQLYDKQTKIKDRTDTIEQVFAFTPVNDSYFSITSKGKSTVFLKRASSN